MILDYTDYRFSYRVLSAASPAAHIEVSRRTDNSVVYGRDGCWWFSRPVNPWRLNDRRMVPLGGLAVRASRMSGTRRSYGVASGHRSYGVYVPDFSYVVF